MTLDLSKLDALDKKRTKGRWHWWTSNSWKRLRAEQDGGRTTVSVIEPYASRSDGHPDCIVTEDDMAFIAELANAWPELRRRLEAPSEEEIVRIIRDKTGLQNGCVNEAARAIASRIGEEGK